MMRRAGLLAAALLVIWVSPSGCTLRLGGPGPQEFSTLAIVSVPGAEPVREEIDAVGADVMFLLSHEEEDPSRIRGEILLPGLQESADADRLPPLRTRPAPSPPIVAEARGSVGSRPVHLFTAWVPAVSGDPLTELARALLLRIAEEVPGSAVVVLAVAFSDPAGPLAFERMVGSYLRGVDACDETVEPPPALRIYHAPAGLVACAASETVTGGSGLVLRLRTRG